MISPAAPPAATSAPTAVEGPQNPTYAELKTLVGATRNSLATAKENSRYATVDTMLNRALAALAPIPGFAARANAVEGIPLAVKWGMAGTKLLASSANAKIERLISIPVSDRPARETQHAAVLRQLDMAIERAKATEDALKAGGWPGDRSA